MAAAVEHHSTPFVAGRVVDCERGDFGGAVDEAVVRGGEQSAESLGTVVEAGGGRCFDGDFFSVDRQLICFVAEFVFGSDEVDGGVLRGWGFVRVERLHPFFEFLCCELGFFGRGLNGRLRRESKRRVGCFVEDCDFLGLWYDCDSILCRHCCRLAGCDDACERDGCRTSDNLFHHYSNLIIWIDRRCYPEGLMTFMAVLFVVRGINPDVSRILIEYEEYMPFEADV